MEFNISNGKGFIGIGMSEIGSYFSFKNPLAIVWHDCMGSVGKFVCALPYDEDDKKKLQEQITESLNEDFSGRTEELYSVLSPLFQLFRNGNYKLAFSNNLNRESFQYQTSTDDFSQIHYFSLDVIFSQLTDVNLIEEKRKEYKKNTSSNEYYRSNILEYTTNSAYDCWNSFFATQPISDIDENRVNYFQEKIKKGERPFAILFQARLDDLDLESPYFILDGHHKLLAYQKLGIYPPLCFITHKPKSISEVEFDVERLSQLLYPWQIQHILENWDEKNLYIGKYLDNPNSSLQRFVKNGEVKEYHDNGRLKHQGFYSNDIPHGEVKEWHSN